MGRGRTSSRGAQGTSGSIVFPAAGLETNSHFNAPKQYWDLYDPAEIKLPETDFSQERSGNCLHNGQKFPLNLPNQYNKYHQAREMRRGYYANISYMDAQVGKVLDELDRLQLRDNTIIVLWSDHGFHLGENSLWAKTSNFELDARVPMIISTPQFNRKQSTESLVELLDIYPTLTDLCRLPSPDNLEGKSLVPILKHPQAKVKTSRINATLPARLSSSWANPEAMGYSIRTSRYRYTEWRDFRTLMSLLRNFMTITRIPAKQIMSLTTRRQAFENS